LTQINATDEDEVRAALAQIPVLPTAAGAWRIARLPSLTNRTFLVERGETEAYVLRLPGKGTASYIDRAGEAANARAAAGIGITPPVLHADPASGVMLSRYLAGAVPLTPERLREGNHFRAAVGLLKRLHDSKLAFQGEMRLYPKIDQYLALASTPALRALRRAGEALRPLLERDWAGALRPCHIDPTPVNFIAVADRYFLVDWEYAAMCQPLWDLAGLSIEGHFDAAQDAAMLALYFGEAADLEAWQSRLHLYRIMLRLVAASWGAVQIAAGNGSWTAAELVDPLVALTDADLSDPGLSRHIEKAR
jgi:thiamine kinase-like enzyme